METVILENGLTGIVTVVEEDQQLWLFEVEINGERFLCHDNSREKLKVYLDGIPETEAISLTFFYSFDVYMKRVNKNGKSTRVVDTNQNPTWRHCTIKEISRQNIWMIFNDTAEQGKNFDETTAQYAVQKRGSFLRSEFRNA